MPDWLINILSGLVMPIIGLGAWIGKRVQQLWDTIFGVNGHNGLKREVAALRTELDDHLRLLPDLLRKASHDGAAKATTEIFKMGADLEKLEERVRDLELGQATDGRTRKRSP